MGSNDIEGMISSPDGFHQALCHLYEEAMAAGWPVPAHFIGVAAEAMRPHLCEDDTDFTADISLRLTESRASPALIDSDGSEPSR